MRCAAYAAWPWRAHPLSVTGLAFDNPRASPIRGEGTTKTGKPLQVILEISMSNSDADLKLSLTFEEFPLSAKYDPEWVVSNKMGPNVLWLAESLNQIMQLEPGMRVLDMGCGTAISSIFFAKELGLQVWATDLWIGASDNWARIREADMEKHVFPIYAEAHSLPFANGFFDALVSLDAYHYFGTDDLYIDRYSQLVKTGGQIGIVVPGLTQEFTSGIPEHIAWWWEWDYCTFHSPEWWHNHWTKSGKVEVELADSLPNGWKHWSRWCEVLSDHHSTADDRRENLRRCSAMLEEDAGSNIGFTRMVARRI